MSRQIPLVGVAMTVVLAVLAGCQPQQPFYLKHVDGDLAHYKGVATEIEYPDVDADRLDDVSDAQRPFSLTNNDQGQEIWDLTLEEAMQIALRNNKVMRNIGGQVQGPPDFILRNPETGPDDLRSGHGREQSADRPRGGAVGVRRPVQQQLDVGADRTRRRTSIRHLSAVGHFRRRLRARSSASSRPSCRRWRPPAASSP